MNFIFLRTVPVNLLRYLPKELAKDITFKNTLNICSNQHEKMRLKLMDIARQFFVSTATWGLDDWERVLAIPTVWSESYEVRRNRILLKLQGCQTSTRDFMNQLISRYVKVNGENYIKEINEKYSFQIVLGGEVKDYKGLFEAINLYKPAHLGHVFRLKRSMNIEYKTGIINNVFGRKQIQISLPEKSNMITYVGLVHICSGRKKVQIERPAVAVQKTFVGQIIRRTGRITIGGAR